MSHIVARNRGIVSLLFLMSILPNALFPAASAQTTVRVPLIAMAVPPEVGQIAVHGQAFTPGGLAYIAIYDRWGVDVHVHLWTIAAGAQFGPNGSNDPAQGYVAAGSIAEVIDLFPATIYGPNGSQDPAQGFVPAGDQVQAGVACGRDLMIRAYDHQAATWSNVVDVNGAC